MVHAEIVAFGGYVPEKVLDNNFFINNPNNPYLSFIGEDEDGKPIFAQERVQLTEEKILKSTGGIKERRVAADGETLIDFIERAFAKTGFPAEELEGIIIGSISYPYSYPSLACQTQERIGAKNAKDVYPLQAACSGFTHAVHNARNAIKCGAGPYLVVGADALSRITDYTEVNCDLFGDGCGLFVLAPTNDENRGILATEMGSDTSGLCSIYQGKSDGKLRMPAGSMAAGGEKVFKVATRSMLDLSHAVVEKVPGIEKSDVSLYIPHQANGNIVDLVAQKLERSGGGRVYRNIERFGNMSSATVPYALYEAISTGVLKRGDLTVLVDFGAGFSKGAVLARV